MQCLESVLLFIGWDEFYQSLTDFLQRELIEVPQIEWYGFDKDALDQRVSEICEDEKVFQDQIRSKKLLPAFDFSSVSERISCNDES
jgi:hypothetical protein